MRKHFAVWFAALFLAASTAHAVEYGFDKAHTHIGFTVTHIFSKVPGEFKDYEGSFTFDPAHPEEGKARVVIQAASIDTGVEMRDHHLRSPDFFDVEKYPTLTFVSKSVAKGSMDNHYNMTGDLTIHGVTKPVTLDVEYNGSGTMPMGKDGKDEAKIAGFTATTTIDRRDFGLVWNKALAGGNLMVGNDVAITLDVAGMDMASLKKMQKMMDAMKKKMK
jgi:polyisoprenoid-binding protein YceI